MVYSEGSLQWENATAIQITGEVNGRGERIDSNDRPTRSFVSLDRFETVELRVPVATAGTKKCRMREVLFEEVRERGTGAEQPSHRNPTLIMDILPLIRRPRYTPKVITEVYLPDIDKGFTGFMGWKVICKNRNYIVDRITGILKQISDALNAEQDTRLVYVRLREGRYHFDSENNIVIDVQKCLSRAKHGKKMFDSIVTALKICRNALEDNTVITKRGLYYKGINTFKIQSYSDGVIDLIAMNFAVSRCCLNILASPKGAVYGNITFVLKTGETLNCLKCGEHGASIPCLGSVMSYSCIAKFAVVVEKATIFSELISSQFAEKHGPCIVISGGGYPDARARSLVALLSKQKHLPLYSLTDLDPHGMDIYLCYKYGSRSMAHRNALLASPTLKWIDISSLLHDTRTLEELRGNNLIPLQKADIAKAVSMVRNKRDLLRLEPAVMRSLQLLLIQSYMHEIELYTLDTLINTIILSHIKPHVTQETRHICFLPDVSAHS